MKLNNLLLLICISLSSCSAQKPKLLGETKLILSIEEKDYNKDRVTQYKIFENGIFEKAITHDSGSQENLFKSELKELNKKELEQVIALEKQLSKLDYENSFPWKEGLYKRGNVFQFNFIASKELEYLRRKSAKDTKEIQYSKILYYYEGHKESPQLFKDLVSLIKSF